MGRRWASWGAGDLQGALGLGGPGGQGPQCPGVGLSLEGARAVTGGGKAWLRTGWGAGAGPPVWDAVQPWCSRALTHGLGPCGLWGSEDIFSMESSRWRSLSG